MAMKNYIGLKFGRGTVIAEAKPYVSPQGVKLRKGLLQCSCGKQYEAMYSGLVSGKTNSCGCLHWDITTKSGQFRYKDHLRTCLAWRHMKSRCHNPNHKQFSNYGGRGIKVCQRWRESFWNFLEDMGDCPPGLQIDRINNNGNYEPGNCRWATSEQQQRNKRTNRLFTVRGVDGCLTELANKFGAVSYQTVRQRLSKGWDTELAFTHPPTERAYRRRPLPFLLQAPAQL